MNSFSESISVIDNANITMVTVNDGVRTVFAGVADNKVIDMVFSLDRMSQLLIRAVNNRTRERNYFRKYTELLEGDITEDEFDREIEEHEDDYVVSNNKDADAEDIKIAMFLAQYLKDVDYADDMSDIFSFSNESVRKSIAKE